MQIKYTDKWVSEVDVSSGNERTKQWNGAGRIVMSIWGNPSPEDIDPVTWNKEQLALKWDEIDVKGSLVWKAYNKAEINILKLAIKESAVLIKKGLKDAGVSDAVLEQYDDLKWQFSRKAGCSCGCSPGFVLKTKEYKTVKPGNYRNVSVGLSLETAEQKAKADENKAKAFIRRANTKVEEAKAEIESLEYKISQAKLELEKARVDLEEATTNKTKENK